MGNILANKGQPNLSSVVIEDLKKQTGYDEETIQAWFQIFVKHAKKNQDFIESR